jgi:hypothetical protein
MNPVPQPIAPQEDAAPAIEVDEEIGDETEVADFGCDYGGPVWYIEGDYLLWWLNGDSAPPLVTTSTPGTPRLQAGILGQPGTSVLFGGDDLADDAHSGARIVLGRWITTDARLEGEWFDLGEVSSEFSESSTGTPILARPFFNVTTGFQDAYLVAFPGIREGSISASADSRLMGGSINIVQNWTWGCYGADAHWNLAVGLRYLRLEEGISISDSLTSIEQGGPVAPGTRFTTADDFDTTNDFFGLNLGIRGKWQWNCWDLSCAGNLGLGKTYRKVTIAGSSTTTTPAGATTDFTGGLLAMPTNIGTYQNSQFGIVPQIQLKLAYCITRNVRIIAGYDAMFWSSVARPGDQIDTSVNTSQASGQPLVGQSAPNFRFNESVLWVQGVSLGGEWRF